MKTLKDLGPCGFCNHGKTMCPDYNELRQAAVEWIKELNKLTEPYCHFCMTCGAGFRDKEYEAHGDHNILDEFPYETSDISGSIKWIMHFFNITEEDLK